MAVRLNTLRSWLKKLGPVRPRNGMLPICPAAGWSKQGVVCPAVQSTGVLLPPEILSNPEFGFSQKVPLGVLKTPIWSRSWSMVMLRNIAVSPTNDPVVNRLERIENGDPVVQ